MRNTPKTLANFAVVLLCVLPVAILGVYVADVTSQASGTQVPSLANPFGSVAQIGNPVGQPQLPPPPVTTARIPNTKVEVLASLDKTHVTPGEKVRLTEVIPVSREGRVGAISHTVYLIAEFDQPTSAFVNLHPEFYRWREPKIDFDGLPAGLLTTGPDGFGFTVTNPRQQGIEFEFVPQRLGIFLITARWHMQKEERHLHSQPVILVVQPPADENGKPVIKAEWLIK